MVKAIKIEQFGGPEVLEFKEIEIPKLNPNEVLVANKSVGLNFINNSCFVRISRTKIFSINYSLTLNSLDNFR